MWVARNQHADVLAMLARRGVSFEAVTQPEKPAQPPAGGSGALGLGTMYTRRQIHELLGGTVQGYLPMVRGRVVCGAFKRSLNPNVPDVILGGDAPVVRKGAEVFCKQKYPVPIFLKAARNEWEYIGDYQVDRWTEDAAEIAKHEALSGRPYIARVMFLKRVG
jgi:hypothetical protein